MRLTKRNDIHSEDLRGNSSNCSKSKNEFVTFFDLCLSIELTFPALFWLDKHHWMEKLKIEISFGNYLSSSLRVKLFNVAKICHFGSFKWELEKHQTHYNFLNYISLKNFTRRHFETGFSKGIVKEIIWSRIVTIIVVANLFCLLTLHFARSSDFDLQLDSTATVSLLLWIEFELALEISR